MTTCQPTIHEDKMLALKLTPTTTLVVLLVPKLERFHVPADRSQDVRLCLKRCELILCRGCAGVSTLGQLQQVRKLTIQQFCNLNSHMLPSFGCVVWRRLQQVPAAPKHRGFCNFPRSKPSSESFNPRCRSNVGN
jgi:hypothetical protein